MIRIFSGINGNNSTESFKAELSHFSSQFSNVKLPADCYPDRPALPGSTKTQPAQHILSTACPPVAVCMYYQYSSRYLNITL